MIQIKKAKDFASENNAFLQFSSSTLFDNETIKKVEEVWLSSTFRHVKQFHQLSENVVVYLMCN